MLAVGLHLDIAFHSLEQEVHVRVAMESSGVWVEAVIKKLKSVVSRGSVNFQLLYCYAVCFVLMWMCCCVAVHLWLL